MEGKTNNNRRSNPSKSEKSLKAIAFNKRKNGLKKKIFELSTLCGLEACMISIGPDGEIDTWPEEKPKLKSIIDRYRSFNEEERGKNNTDISEYLETKRNKLEVEGEIGCNGSCEEKKKKKNSNSTKYPSWDERLDRYSEKDLRELRAELDTRMENVRQREELKKNEKEEGEGEKQSKILKEEEVEREESENKALVTYTSDVPESNTDEFIQQLLFDPTVLDEPPPYCCSSSIGVSSSWNWDWNHQPQIIFGSTNEFIYDDSSSMKFDGMKIEQSASNLSYGYETMDDLILMCQMGTEQSPSLLPVISQQTPPPLATILPSSAQQVFRFHTKMDQDQFQVKGGGRGPKSINC